MCFLHFETRLINTREIVQQTTQTGILSRTLLFLPTSIKTYLLLKISDDRAKLKLNLKSTIFQMDDNIF